jgi:hypothetical protein
MKIAFDLIRSFSARLMLVALMALSLPAGASASGLGGMADGPNDACAYQSLGQSSEAVSSEQGGLNHVHQGTPCKSTCCSVSCSMAVLGVQTTVPVPAQTAATRSPSVFQDAQGIDLNGFSRPPKGPLPI